MKPKIILTTLFKTAHLTEKLGSDETWNAFKVLNVLYLTVFYAVRVQRSKSKYIMYLYFNRLQCSYLYKTGFIFEINQHESYYVCD
jgi:hypothetical protein